MANTTSTPNATPTSTATATSNPTSTLTSTSTSTPTSTPNLTSSSTATPNLTSSSSPFATLEAHTGAPLAPASSSFLGPVTGALFLAAIAVAAFVLSRRRRGLPRLVEIIETASLGPKRSLVVARLGDELLVLGSSEGGIALLQTRPAPPRAAAAPAPAAAPAQPAAPAPPFHEAFAATLRAKLRGHAAPPQGGFDALLSERLEDAELRRKLASGYAGSVR